MVDFVESHKKQIRTLSALQDALKASRGSRMSVVIEGGDVAVENVIRYYPEEFSDEESGQFKQYLVIETHSGGRVTVEKEDIDNAKEGWVGEEFAFKFEDGSYLTFNQSLAKETFDNNDNTDGIIHV